MMRIAKSLCVMGAIWIPLSFATSYYIMNMSIWRGGLMDVDKEAAYESQLDWYGRLLNGFLSLGLLGVIFLILGAFLVLVSWLIRRPTALAVPA